MYPDLQHACILVERLMDLAQLELRSSLYGKQIGGGLRWTKAKNVTFADPMVERVALSGEAHIMETIVTDWCKPTNLNF
ncbi:hypothetical protein CGRA01v4_06121 [Colletotrichum graminicola]|uniref:Uncharacterized protein n=1 Tax=Colletotrichum graminicola (strain M1.001 / M2 / FGSC 10212) TaxID=645133 RepID=E3R0P4_COLGM|nr:uncharacterized protein GLRG_11828 [Colletotrichum graminicola M1.001]EFQ36682.1 hypothetical protein GLRG_11828 [Colletotrichum graminicola M1.001]WDK14840.1 hypothetical protein CGRA01v4_06121 [Colletotrichum graminicola]